MKINDILFSVSIVFLICFLIIVIVVIRYLVVLWLEVKKARQHFNQLEPKMKEITERVRSIENNVNEIENTPLIQPQLTTTMRRYGKVAKTIMKSKSKYRMKNMQKQEKKFQKKLKNMKKQTKKYQKNKVKGSQTYGK